MMFQSYALFPHLTCLDNVAFSLRTHDVGRDERRRRAAEMLARVHCRRWWRGGRRSSRAGSSSA
jgi:putative spermidine/putrescine transport system ATP-binding protein